MLWLSAGPAVPSVPPSSRAAAPAGGAAGCGPAPAPLSGGEAQSGPGSVEREPPGCPVAPHHIKHG